MKKSKLSILLLFLVMILAISAVSAADDTNDTSDAVMQAVDEAPLEEVASDSDVVGATDDTDIIADEGNNFTSLQTLIDKKGETVILDKDYVRVEGDSSLNINEDTTIVGGYHKIDAANLGGIFNVKSGVTLVLTGVTLVNGNSDYGGAIYNEGIVNIYDSTFENNTATVDGGAIYNNGTIEQLSSSTFKNNLAIHDGGAVYTNTDLTVDYNSVFNENTAKNEGGAIFAKAKSSLTVDQTTFSENKVSEGNYVHGGAIATGTSCSLIVTGCIFEDNVADLTKNSQGGAIWTQASCNVTITDSSFTNNQASRKGGAIYTGSKNSLIIKDSTFTKNTAAYAGSNGGAIAMYTNGELSIEGDCEFIANSAANGGAIHLDRTDANITGAVFSGNDAANQGGAIYLFESGKTVSVKNSTFTDNTNNGEANSIYLSIGNLELSGNTIHGNESEIYVAKSGKLLSEITVDILNHETVTTYDGTYLVNATVTDDNGNPMTIVKGLTFVTDGAEVEAVYNATTGVYEGLLILPAPGIFTVNATYIDEEKLTVKTATIKNFKGTFQDLQTRVNNCGGVLDLPYDFAYTPELGDTTSTGIRVSNNLIINGNGHTISGSNAARIFDISAPTTIDNLTIADGYYTASYGGAAIKATAMLNVTNTNFTNNGASDLIDKSVYGAVRTSTSASFDKCIFTDNYGRWGGAIGAEGSGTITIKNSKFENNNARQGGAIDIEGYTLIIDNTEFIGNDAVMFGGAVHTSQGTVTTVTNSKFERNTDYQGGAICSKGSTGSLTIDNSEFIANEVTGTEMPVKETWSSGGAIWVENTLTLTNSNFTANKAEYNGGAVYIQPGNNNALVDNCRFEDNTAGAWYGALYYSGSGTLTVSDSYFDNNTVAGKPNAIGIFGGNLALSGNTITGDEAQILLRDDSGSTSKVTSQVNITVMDNEEHNFSFHGVTLYAVVTDDNGNLITDSGFKFLVNTTEVTATYNPDTKLYEATYTPSDVGKYVVSMTYDGTATLIVKTANITFTKSLIDIQNMIDAADAGDTIQLTGDYAYVEEFDSSIKNGIVVNKTVTIDGKGYTISGSDAARIFNVGNNAGLTLSNVTLTKGYANEGAAILVDEGATLNADYITVSDNKITDFAGSISNYGIANIDHSVFDGNDNLIHTGDVGASAIFSCGTLIVNNTVFENNVKIKANRTNGDLLVAVLANMQGNLEVYNSNFTNNSGVYGGALYTAATDSQVKTIVDNCRFVDNTAYAGGAIYGYGTVDLDIINSYFENNVAIGIGSTGYTAAGGAIVLINEEDANIYNCTFKDNKAIYGALPAGGAIHVDESTAVVDLCTFEGNVASNGVSPIGGAIASNKEAVLTVKNSNFTGNEATNGSAIFSAGVLTLSGNKVFSDKAEIESTGTIKSTIKIIILDGEVKTIETLEAKLSAKVTDDKDNLIKDAQFKFTINDEEVDAVYNASTKLYEATYTLPSAGIYPVNITYASDDELEVENGTVKSIYGTFTYLQKLAGLGPFIEIVRNYTYVEEIDGEALKDGVVFGDYAYYNINGNGYTISGNDVARIFNIRATVLINNITFANGNAVDGGAVYIGSVSSGFVGFNPTYVNFINNTATRYGGAIYSEVAIDPVNCLFEDNAAGIYGGAIYIDGDLASSVSNSVFENNTAMQGGAIFHQKTGLIVKNSTFNDNKAIGTANGEWASGAAILSYLTEYVTIKDSNFTANNAQYNGGAIYFYNSNVDGNCIIDNCRFEENVAGDSYGTIYVTNCGNCEVNFDINNTKFINNTNKATTADYGSAALMFMGNDLNITNAEFTGNKGTKYSAIYYYARTEGNLNIENTNFTGNEASVGQAVIDIVNGNAVITNAKFDSNNAATYCEAIYIRAAANVEIKDSEFTKNGELVDYAIYNLGTLKLTDTKVDNLVYNKGKFNSKLNATILENKTWDDKGLFDTYILNATLTDENGNKIYDPIFRFAVDRTPIDEVKYDKETGLYTAEYYIANAGYKVVSTNYTADNLEIFTGALDIELANVTEFTVTVADVLEGDATVFVTLVGICNQTLNATVTVIINNKPITVTVTNGTGSEVVENLTHGQYPVVAMLTNCPNYNDAINSTVFYVKGQSKLTIANLTTAEYGDVIEVIINLTDADGNPLNGTVVINETIQVLVENGIGKFVTIEGSNPDVGEYYFNATYEGNDELFGCSKGFTVNVTVKEIDPDDVKVEIDTINICPDGINVTITAPVDGNYTVTVNGTVTNVEVVDSTGIATITGLEPGIYNATVDIAEDEYSMKTITTDEFEYFMVPEFNVVITGTYPNAVISITGPEGTYHVLIGDDEYNITREASGLPTIKEIDGIDAGNYIAIVSFDGHDQYYGDAKDFNFTIDKANATVTVAVSDIVEGEFAVIEVYADSDDIDSVNATVKLIIDGKTYGEVKVVNGSAKVPLTGFEQGSHDVIAVLADNNYNYASASDRFFVKHATNLTVSADAEYVYGEPIEISVSLNATSQSGVFTVSITVGEEGYNVLVENGVGKLIINNKLPVGEYNVTSYFAGDDINNYTEGNLVSFNVTPLKINSSDVTVNFTGHAPDGLTITVTSPVDGNYTVAIGNQTNVTVEVKDCQGVATAYDLEVGNYLATTTIDDPNYTLDKYSLVVYRMVPEFDATITGTYPTATVTINGTAGYYMVYVKDVGFTTINVTEDGAFVSGTIKNITAGNYNATVAYFIGNGTYGYTSKEIPFTVGKAEALNITYDGDLGVMGAGTVNITVAPDATGYVIIDNDGNTVYGELVNGSFAFDIYDLTAGDYTIVVTYYGDDNYNKTEATKVLDIPKSNVTPEISNVTAEILEGQDATFTVTVNNNFATGNVTIFVDGVPTQVVVLDDASANVTISDLKYGTHTITVQYNGDDNYQGAANATTSIKVYNNVVTNETFFKYFDENGILRDVVSFDELIFKGEFSDLTDYVIINMPITITGEEASLYNMGFSILSDDVVLDNMTLVADTSLGDLIGVYDYEDVVISNMDITYKVNNESSVAIKVYGSSNVGIYNNTIYFESHAPTDDIEAMAIAVEDASSVEIDNNDITANLTAVRSNWGIYSKYGTMGIDQVHAVRIAGTSDVDLTDNEIIAIINDGISTGGYDSPTIEAVLVIDSELVLVDNNNISVLDPITPAGTPSFLYGMTLTAVYDACVSNNEFYLSTDGGIDATGTSYAIQLATCDVDIVRNTIVALNNGPNLGIYVSGVASYSSFYNEDFTVTIENNDINITGYANSTNYGSLISGIEACAGQIDAFNNTITVNNLAGYVEGINVQGISYAQTYNPYKPVFDIEDNTIIVKDGDYAVAIINNATSTVINNYLIAHELYGDDAVEANEDAIVEANYPQDLYLFVYAEDIYVNDSVEIFVNTNPLFSGNVSVVFNGRTYQVEIIDGEGSTGLLDSVPASTYIVNATYDGNYYFMPDNDYSNFTVYKYASNMTITVGDVVVDQDLEVNISLPFADGNVTILLDDGTQATVKLVDGEGNYTITKDHMTAGNHSITVFLSGNPEYVDVTEIYNFTVEKAENYTFEVNLTVDEINYGENTTINVTLPEDANGMIIVSVDDEIVTYEHVVNGTASVTIPADEFTAGDFNEIEVTYSDDKYGETTKATDIFVNKLPSDLTATADDIELGQNATVVIKLPTYTDGDVYVELLGEVYYPVEWKVIFENLTEGTYTVYVYLEDDSIFEDNMTSVTFNVTKVVIPPEDAFNFTTPENSTSEVISVELPDDATGFLLLDINGTQTHVPLVDGKANVTVPLLPEGTYNATITYTGDEKYSPISTTKELNVTSNVPDNALSIPDSAKSDAPTAYSISLPEDATGYLEVDVDGTKYAAPLNKGSASVTIPALSAGNHNVTVTYTGDGKYSPVVKSTSLNVTAPVFKITNNKNVAAVYSAKATYKVLVTRDGKAVGAGETVTFKYNGKTYTVKTDAKGYATFKPTTKVKVKKYTVTATYKGVTVKNTVTIKHVLKVKNAKIKKSKKVNKIKVKTKKVNGKYLKGKKLTLKIKGKKVKAKTNKKGVATFKLKKKVTKKLKAGKKYKFTVTYGKDKVTKKAKVRK